MQYHQLFLADLFSYAGVNGPIHIIMSTTLRYVFSLTFLFPSDMFKKLCYICDASSSCHIAIMEIYQALYFLSFSEAPPFMSLWDV